MIEAGYRWHGGPGAGRDDERPRSEAAAVHLEAIAPDEAAVALDDVDAEPAEAFRAVVGFDAADHRGDPFHHLREVDLRRRGGNRPALGMAHLPGDARRLDQRLRRHAAVPQAIAAQSVLLDQRHLGAERRATRGDDESAGAAANDDEIELGSSHRKFR